MTDERARLGEEVVSMTDERVPEGGARLGEEVVFMTDERVRLGEESV